MIPSLIDFGIGDPDNLRNQRWQILSDPNFFWMMFEPLLEISKKYKEQIYAWEVMNEPSWLNSDYFPRAGLLKYVSVTPKVTFEQVDGFLKEAIARIHKHGFESTVGHRYFDDLKRYQTGSIPQFHYYPESINPKNRDPKEIPDALATGMNPPPIFGEFGSDDQHGGPWPDIQPSEPRNTPDRVFERMKLLQRKNYGLAMIWPDKPYKYQPDDPERLTKDTSDTQIDALKLTSDAELGIYKYLDYFNLR